MRILVTGANGMLGNAIKRVFSNYNLLLTDKSTLNITKRAHVLSFAKKKPDLILHLAALTDLKAAETNPKVAYLVNHAGTKNLTNLARELDIPIVYISTGMVFKGTQKSNSETDSPKPTNHYGKSKYKGEKSVAKYKKHFIVRSGWAFGGGREIDKKFINKIFTQIAQGSKKLYGITDIYGNPTYTIDFAKTLKNLIDGNVEYGTYNSPGVGVASRYDVLHEFVNLLGLKNKIETVPVTVDEYHSLFPTPFPYIKREVLGHDKLAATGLSAMRPWQLALAEYAEEFK